MDFLTLGACTAINVATSLCITNDYNKHYEAIWGNRYNGFDIDFKIDPEKAGFCLTLKLESYRM